MSFETFLGSTRPDRGRSGSASGTAPTPSVPPPSWAQARTTRPRSPSETASARRRPGVRTVAALTEMLYERGIAVEMTAFHQLPAGEDTATFVRGSDGGHSEWAMGLADDPTQSALRAVIACANRLLAVA